MQVFGIPPDDAGTLPDLTFSPDGQILIVNTRKRALLFDTVNGQWLKPMPGLNAQFVLGGQAIAYLGFQTGLSVMELPNREHRSRVPPTKGQALVAAPDGQTIYLLSDRGSDGMTEVQTYDVAIFACRNTFARYKGRYDQLVGSANGRKLATGDPGEEGKPVRVWDVEQPNSSPVEGIPKGKWRHFALSADGSRLGTATTKSVALWEIPAAKPEGLVVTGEEIFSSGRHRCAVQAVCFHPTRSLMATGGRYGDIFLWDYTGRVLTRYDWGLDSVYAINFSHDGLRCAATNAFKGVIWDVDV